MSKREYPNIPESSKKICYIFDDVGDELYTFNTMDEILMFMDNDPKSRATEENKVIVITEQNDGKYSAIRCFADWFYKGHTWDD